MKPSLALPIPPSYDLDSAPQLISVAMVHAALGAIQLALERAHPVLPRLGATGPAIELSDSEHLAQVAILAADELAERLHDYAASLEGEFDPDDLLPF
jgi:hypothetical protein